MPAAGQTSGEGAALEGSCFAQSFDRDHLAQHPRQRVSEIAVQFYGFEGALLASVSYRLRYGTKFAFSGDCRTAGEGYFLCSGCTNGNCAPGEEERFSISRLGGDGLALHNDETGLLGGNPAGGRDYVISLREQSAFLLQRGEPSNCAW